jgi:hypothetical protein
MAGFFATTQRNASANMAKLPPDWHRRSFAQKLSFVACAMRHGPRPSASHREWLYDLAKDQAKLRLILDAGKRFQNGPLLATVKGSEMDSWDVAVSEAAVRYHAHERWADYGCQTFQVGESLAALLALTDATVGYDAIEWPFPAFLLEVPAGYLPVLDLPAYRERPVRILVHDHLRAQGYGPDHDVPEERWLHIEAFFGDHTLASCAINKRVEDLADGIAKDLLKTYGDGYSPELVEVRNGGKSQQVMEAILSFVCGFALWFTSTGGTEHRTPTSKLNKRKVKKTKIGWPTVWIVGRSVKLDRALREAAKEAALTARTRSGWRLKKQQLVSGHWKQQPHGPGRKLRKLIHVAPYLRGPDGDEAWTRVYKATKEDES